jgi:GDP-L-fucose synthase
MSCTSFWPTKHVLVTGGAGFLGSAIVRGLRERGARAITVPRQATCDLRQMENVRALFKRITQQSEPGDVVVIHAAARVGGIGANRRQPASFFYDNLIMGAQLMDEACRHGIGKFVSIGTVCAYPEHARVPFSEDQLWHGYPEPTNAPYGLAKKMLLVQGAAYRSQYGFNAIFLLPTNLYGPADHFDLQDSHVIPALIRKCVEAREQRQPTLTAWGTGSPTRDYLYVDDAADGILLAAELYDAPDPVNLSGNGAEISVRDLATRIQQLTGYEGAIVWDTSQPDGQPRRKVDSQRARNLFGFRPRVNLEEGLERTISWFETHRA